MIDQMYVSYAAMIFMNLYINFKSYFKQTNNEIVIFINLNICTENYIKMISL